MAFAPRMHVFPGGRVDEIDTREQVYFLSGDVDALAVRASTDANGVRALYSCAVRETEEEAGIAISSRDDQGRLLIDPSLLPIIDHWVTPETESHRYDVRFFASVIADGQASLTTTEADVAVWIAPAAALAEFAAGRMAMLPPTESVLRRLTEFDRAADVIADAPSRPVLPLLPKQFVEADGRVHWAMVNDRTGEILDDAITMPHTREVDGLPTDSES